MGCLLLFFSTALAWPLSLVIDRFRRLDRPPQPLPGRLARWLAWGYCVLSLYFLIAFMGMMTDPEIVFHVPVALERILIIPVLLAVLAVAVAVLAALAWARRYWGYGSECITLPSPWPHLLLSGGSTIGICCCTRFGLDEY